jgi:hypothetical protein
MSMLSTDVGECCYCEANSYACMEIFFLLHDASPAWPFYMEQCNNWNDHSNLEP